MTERNYRDHPIVGTWRLTSFTEKNLETIAVSHPFGVASKALVIYEANGYVATIFTRSDRKSPLGPQPTDQEAMDLYRSMIAFAGR
jgi:Lipocalin-like domain